MKLFEVKSYPKDHSVSQPQKTSSLQPSISHSLPAQSPPSQQKQQFTSPTSKVTSISQQISKKQPRDQQLSASRKRQLSDKEHAPPQPFHTQKLPEDDWPTLSQAAEQQKTSKQALRQSTTQKITSSVGHEGQKWHSVSTKIGQKATLEARPAKKTITGIMNSSTKGNCLYKL